MSEPTQKKSFWDVVDEYGPLIAIGICGLVALGYSTYETHVERKRPRNFTINIYENQDNGDSVVVKDHRSGRTTSIS